MTQLEASELPATILMVDDDRADAFATKRALLKSSIGNRLDFQHMISGEEFLEFLSEHSPGEANYPDLVLLDINMPRINGFEVLARIREMDLQNRMPIVVLTTSVSEEDSRRAYTLGASTFITKPSSLADMNRFANSLAEYWFGLVALS